MKMKIERIRCRNQKIECAIKKLIHSGNNSIDLYPTTRRSVRSVIIASLFFAFSQTDIVADELAELRELVISLKKDVQALQSEVSELKNEKLNCVTSDQLNNSIGSETTNNVSIETVPVEVHSQSEGPHLNWYGFVKATIFHDSATTFTQEIPYWTLQGTEGLGETDITAKESRFGFDVENPGELFGGTLTGKVEMDFYGRASKVGDFGQNHAYQLRSRHIYAKWSNAQWSAIAGKTTQVYAIVTPETLNAGYYNFQGRLGHRRAQLQGTRILNLNAGRRLSITGALEEPVGGIHGADFDLNNSDDASDTEMPGLTGRLRYDFPGLGGHDSYLSLAGFYGEESVFDKIYKAYGIVVGGTFPINDWLQLKGTYWSGSNMDSARGAIGQGINIEQSKAIAANGGWVQIKIKPQDNYWFNVGYSLDDPNDDDLNAEQRTSNETYLFNGYFKIADSLTWGLEYINVKTGYKEGESATNHRLESSMIYHF